jgi:glycosyltransferase involved in cell wall biosynthesis
LETYAVLQQRGWHDVQLALVGAVESEGLEALRADVARQYGLTDLQVVRVGPVQPKQVGVFYGHAVLLLCLSLTESFSNTVIEAMAWGLPVVSSSIPAHQEIVGDAGGLVDLHDSRKAADLCEALLSNESLRTTWAARGRERARRFTWDASARSLLAIAKAAI